MLPHIALGEHANQPFVALHYRQRPNLPSGHASRVSSGLTLVGFSVIQLNICIFHYSAGVLAFLANLLPDAITLVLTEESRLDTVGLKCVLQIGSIGYIAPGN